MGRSFSSWERYKTLTFSLIASIFAAGLLYLIFKPSSIFNALPPPPSQDLEEEVLAEDASEEERTSTPKISDKEEGTTTPPTKEPTEDSKTPITTNKENKSSTTKIHKLIEDADKRGKALFKNKNYLEAATCFTEAIDLIEALSDEDAHQKQLLSKQHITLLNNRSAMYEKASLAELALEDCDKILGLDVGHTKARMRKLRVLEGEKRFKEALVEVCALQLRYVHENRDKLRLGIPVQPPVSQEKINEIVANITPDEVEHSYNLNQQTSPSERPLPCTYFIIQLLKSFSSYNSWMSDAAKGGSDAALTERLAQCDSDVEKVDLLYRRGKRRAYDAKFQGMTEDFELAISIVEEKDIGREELEGGSSSKDLYARLLEWVGVSRHLRYDLDGALKVYDKCSSLEPENVEILVKRAGVLMDSQKYDESLSLFSKALKITPGAIDALLHRSNLYLLQQKIEKSKKDLQKVIQLRPSYTFAKLRLAALYVSQNDLDSAEDILDKCLNEDTSSSEVHSYRGECYFTKGEMSEAQLEFEKAMECDTTNPSPYVNLALTIMNTPLLPGSPPPDLEKVITLLTKAVEIDPQYHIAYVHLGQLKLGMAKDLVSAQEVIELYEKGIRYCRTKEELKDIVNMKVLAVAQVNAASMLGLTALDGM